MPKNTGASADADRATRPADQAPAGLGDTASVPSADECTHFFPERGVGCKLCDSYFAKADDPREVERQERLYREIEIKTLRRALEQIRQIIKDVIGEELEL
jgi:hypothetical protein